MLQRAVLADFALDAVFLLADPATFNSAAYTGVLNELMHGQGTATVSSVQPDIITGGQARGLYNPQPSTINPQISALNPQPSTLNPQPSTLTLNPQPSILNPQPSTLNPQPSTLDP